MSGQQDTETTTPIQVFEKALITAMLKKRRILVTQEEVREYLPKDFDDSKIKAGGYGLAIYGPDSDPDILTLPTILELFTASEKRMIRFLCQCTALHLSIQKIDAAAREYLFREKIVISNSLVKRILDEAEKYFEIRKIESGANGVKKAVFDGNKLITTIYNFFR